MIATLYRNFKRGFVGACVLACRIAISALYFALVLLGGICMFLALLLADAQRRLMKVKS
jgi:hypothetical protein